MFHKVVSALPAELDRDSVYFVRNGSGFDVFVTNHNGGVIHAYPLNAPEGLDDAPEDGRRYGRKNGHWSEIPPISGDLDSLAPANPDIQPMALAVFQELDGELYLDDDYVDDEYVELGLGGKWVKMTLGQLKAWLEPIDPGEEDIYLEPDYVDPDYVGE